MPKNKSHKIGFLIDECLTPDLVKTSEDRGYVSLHVGRIQKLKGRSDRTVAKYALEKEMILVTNNMVDFDKIYQKHNLHPGLIFLLAPEKLMNHETQVLMFSCALEQVEENEPINEAIYVECAEDKKQNLKLKISRCPLP